MQSRMGRLSSWNDFLTWYGPNGGCDGRPGLAVVVLLNVAWRGGVVGSPLVEG